MGFHVNDLSDLPLHTARLRTPRVSVVLPLRNAEEEAEHRIAEIAVEAEYSHISICEIIAVDDDSEDLTWAVLQSLARREPLLRPIRLRRPRRHGRHRDHAGARCAGHPYRAARGHDRGGP